MIEFTLTLLVAAVLLAAGFVVGLAVYAFLFDRHKARIEFMEQKAYRDVREIQIRKLNADAERTLKIRRRNAELPQTPEEEQATWEQGLRNIGHSDEEIEQMAKDRRKM